MISERDRDSFYDQARSIGELTLPEDKDAGFSPQVFARLAQLQLQIHNGPLFPSLHRLRIMGLSTALDFLHLFLTPSLTTLEIAAIPLDCVQYPLVLSFLESAVCEASHIENVVLGPGQISGEILDLCLKYQNLQRLELSSATFSITLQDLGHIGSLERLEYFILRGTSTPVKGSLPVTAPQDSGYDSSPSHPRQDESEMAVPILPTQRSPSPSVWSRCASPDLVSSPSTLGEQHVAEGKATQISDNPSSYANHQLFAVLKELTVAGNPDLVKDLINYISSPDLRELCVTFKSEDMSMSVVESQDLSKKRKGKSRVPTEPALMRDDSELIVSDVLNPSTQKWANTLVSVSFCNGGTVTPSIPFPSDIFETLLVAPQIERLEVTGFNIKSVDTALHRLKEISPSKLKVLHLPFHTATSGVSLSRLRFIALHCPQLVSFRCRFKHLSNVPACDTAEPLSHQLQVLSVANAEPHRGNQRLHQIARYLDSLFPNLGVIETRDEMGYNGDQWESVFDLIKLCQAVRFDDKHRLGKIKAEI